MKTVELLSSALEEGQTPVEFMLNTLRNEDADPKERQWAAEKCAPYVHPRPAPIPRTIEVDLPGIETVEGIKDAIVKIAHETALGNIAPAEAASLTAIVEAQRKAIETHELQTRIEKLETEVERQKRG